MSPLDLTSDDGVVATATGLIQFSELYGYCQRQLNDTDAALLVLIKEWCNAVIQKAENFGRKPPFKYVRSTVDSVAAQAYISAPTYMVGLVRMGTTSGELSVNTRRRMEDATDSGTPTEVCFVRSEAKLYPWPVPDADTTYYIEYQQETPKLTLAAGTCLIPQRYLWVLYAGLDEWLCRYQKDYAGADRAKMSFMRSLVQMLNAEDEHKGRTRMVGQAEAHRTSSPDTIYGSK